MNASDLIREFCETNADKYSVYENYFGHFRFGAKCMGIVVRQGNSYMEMIMHLTKFLDGKDYIDEELLFEGVSIDELGMDSIVYFPKIQS